MKKTSKPTQPSFGGPVLSTKRLEALTDGVFAIVMTLLVFNLKVPLLGPDAPPGELIRQLMKLWPQFFSFVLSVLILGVHWVGYTAQFHYVRRSNRIHHWINILYLLCLAFVPFSAAVLGQYSDDPIAVILYSLNLLAAGLVLYLHFWYVLTFKLVDPGMPLPVIRMAKFRILTGMIVYLIAIPLSFASPKACLVLFILGPLLYILPSPADRYFQAQK